MMEWKSERYLAPKVPTEGPVPAYLRGLAVIHSLKLQTISPLQAYTLLDV